MRFFLVGLMVLIPTMTLAEETRITVNERSDLQVTVYGESLAYVQDVRKATLPAGQSSIAFEGVSPDMIPSSALLRAGDKGQILDIGYDFDIVSRETLLRRSLGGRVGVVRVNPTTGEEKVDEATVVALNNGLILKYRDRIETGEPGRIVFFDIPPGLRDQPTLTATIDLPAAGMRPIDLSYLTSGLSWSTDYVVEVNDADERLTLSGRATISNNSGIGFHDAHWSLVAGEVNRESATQSSDRMFRGMAPAGLAASAPAPAPKSPTREAFADYHLYRLPSTLSLGDRQSRQISLVTLKDVLFKREYTNVGRVGFYPMARGTQPRTVHPDSTFKFTMPNNGTTSEPLPDGIVRVFGRDKAGNTTLIGEARIDNTPVGEVVEISPGQAFDISIDRRQTEFVTQGLQEGTAESAWRIEVRNARDKAVTVVLKEIIDGDWRILSASAPSTRDDASAAVWRVDVPAKGKAELTYRVRMQRT